MDTSKIAPWGKGRPLWPNIAINGCFRGPLRPSRFILVGAKGSQWATMFNRVQPMFNQFEAGRATYGQTS